MYFKFLKTMKKIHILLKISHLINTTTADLNVDTVIKIFRSGWMNSYCRKMGELVVTARRS